MTYRDPREAAKIRLTEAVQRRQDTIARVGGLVAGIRELASQLQARGLPEAEVPEAPRPAPLPASATALETGPNEPGLAELVRDAGLVEAEAALLEVKAQRLELVFALLNDRIQGKTGEALPLGPAPRPVPASYLVTEWAGGIWLLMRWTIFFPPVWAAPWAGREVALGMLALLLLVATVRTSRRASMLRWAMVAQVRLLSQEDTSTKMTNWPVRRASGWTVKTEAYTGYGVKSRLAYLDSDGEQHELTVGGVGYENGVVLYHARVPSRAIAVERFDCRPMPDYQGNWQPGVHGLAVWLRTLAALAAVGYLGWACVAMKWM